MAEKINWPPTYTLKISSRAKRVRITATTRYGLEVTIPKRFALKNISPILEGHKAWIIKQLTLLKNQPPVDKTLPKVINLFSVKQKWKINYVKTTAKTLKLIQRPHHECTLLGNIADEDLCRKKLHEWIIELAGEILVSRLKKISDKTELFYKNVIIRGQRSRWGSCSAGKTISLNYKLIFLPAHLCDHILIHELCHLKHMNHSPRFWALVGQYDHDWETHRLELKKADQYIPGWLED